VSYSTDPRAARSRDAMLGAARELLVADGPGAVTHQRVAQQAGVGRATVYRHWPRSEQLLLDVMAGADLPHFKEPQAPVRLWLRRQLRNLADELEVPAVAAVALTLAQSALWDAEVAQRHDESQQTIRERLEAAVRAAVDSGELVTAAAAVDLAALLVGPIVYRATMERREVSDDLIDRLLDAVGTWRTSG
jgi:AcrR family transcriptional regulator